MTTKPADKAHEPPRGVNPGQDDLRIAYEVHTLAQMLYGQVARTNPWLAQPGPVLAQEPMMGTPFVSWAPAWPASWAGPSYGTIPVPPWIGYPH